MCVGLVLHRTLIANSVHRRLLQSVRCPLVGARGSFMFYGGGKVGQSGSLRRFVRVMARFSDRFHRGGFTRR